MVLLQHGEFDAINCWFWDCLLHFSVWLHRHHGRHPSTTATSTITPFISIKQQPSFPYCTTVQPYAAADAQLQFGRGAVTSPSPPSQSQSLIILSNTYCLCTGGHFGCSHQKSSQPTRWSNLESDLSMENRYRRTVGYFQYHSIRWVALEMHVANVDFSPLLSLKRELIRKSHLCCHFLYPFYKVRREQKCPRKHCER